jgi:hypothetical protein
MLQLMCLDLDKIFKQLEREEKSGKKLKKNEREDGCLRLHWCTGGRGIARSWLYCLCCTTTVYNARLLRCMWL